MSLTGLEILRDAKMSPSQMEAIRHFYMHTVGNMLAAVIPMAEKADEFESETLRAVAQETRKRYDEIVEALTEAAKISATENTENTETKSISVNSVASVAQDIHRGGAAVGEKFSKAKIEINLEPQINADIDGM